MNEIVEIDKLETEANHDSLNENGLQKKILPIRRIFMLSSLLFFIGYSYAIIEGFGIPLSGLSERYAPIVFGISSIQCQRFHRGIYWFC